jgi:hypothetical protein
VASRSGTGATGLVAAIAATIGDFLLLATANATRPGFEWLPAPSEPALWVGTYLGVLAIPCYGLGYRDVARGLPAPHRAVVTSLGVAGGVLGGTTHGLTGLAIHVESAGGMGLDPVALLGRYGAYLLPLWALVGAGLVVGSAAFALGVGSGRPSFPRWMALANPAVLTLAVVFAGTASDTGRAFLVPAAPNVAHVAFFALAAATSNAGRDQCGAASAAAHSGAIRTS